MVYRKKRTAPKRRMAKRKGNRKGRVSTHLNGRAPQFARIVETVNIQDARSNTLNTLGFCLNDFNRARFEANNWQFFKAAKVTWTYEPLYNTYQDTKADLALSKPYLYTRMNRTQDKVVPYGLLGLQGAGAMPRVMTKTIKQTYRPNWNIQGLSISTISQSPYSQAALGARCEYGWINNSSFGQTQTADPNVRAPGALNPSQTGAVLGVLGANTINQIPSYCLYNGHDFYIDQKHFDPDSAQAICRITMTVEWHFKGPVYNQRITQDYTNPT